MKYLTVFLVLLMTGLLLSPAQAQSSYTIEESGITFNYPEGWEVSYSEGFVWMAKVSNDDLSPAIGIEIFNLTEDPEMKDITGAEAFRDKVMVYYGEVYDMLVVENKTYDEAAGVAFASMKYNRKYEFAGLGAYLLKDNTGFALSYEAPLEVFNETEAREDLNIIINSITVSR